MIVTRALRSVITTSSKRMMTSSLTKAKEHKLDPVQEASLHEKCFLVDGNDKIIGSASKKDCHLVSKNGDVLLHRAFSVFLFNKKGDLLLQKRSAHKVSLNVIRF